MKISVSLLPYLKAFFFFKESPAKNINNEKANVVLSCLENDQKIEKKKKKLITNDSLILVSVLTLIVMLESYSDIS